MDTQEFYGRIGLPSEAAARLEGAERKLDLAPFASLLDGLLDPAAAREAYRRLREELPDGPDRWNMLYCHLDCARRAWESYKKRGIPDSIYLDTMKCFPRFLAECRQKQGRMFFDRAWWTWRQTSMRLFRVGALEYEFSSHEGKPALALHIPSDGDLSPEHVDASLAQAEVFFKTYFPDFSYKYCICDSWLLSPTLRPLLRPDSHIRSFQNRFRLLSERPEDREFVEWLYQVPADTAPEALPGNTSLQKGVKALLLQGGTVGCALGVMK